MKRREVLRAAGAAAIAGGLAHGAETPREGGLTVDPLDEFWDPERERWLLVHIGVWPGGAYHPQEPWMGQELYFRDRWDRDSEQPMCRAMERPQLITWGEIRERYGDHAYMLRGVDVVAYRVDLTLIGRARQVAEAWRRWAVVDR